MRKLRFGWLAAAAAALLVTALSGCNNPMDAGTASDAQAVEPWDDAELARMAASLSADTATRRVGRPVHHPRKHWRVDGDDVAHVWISVTSVKVHGEVTGWHSITPPQTEYDLVDLADDAAVVGLNDLPPDSYHHLWFIIGEGSRVEFKDGKKAPLYVPGGKQTGIRVIGAFDIQKDYIAHIALDFDPDRLIKLTYRGRKHWERRFALLPLVRIAEVVQEAVEKGTSNRAPTVSFPSWDYTVQGAGLAGVNGNYTENGNYSTPARPKYDHASGGYHLYAFEASEDGFQHWAIHSTLLPDKSSVFAALYYNGDTTASTPPETGWSVGAGSAGAPAVLRMPISGDLNGTGTVLTGHYLFEDPDGDAEGATEFQWVRFAGPTDTTAGTDIAGAASLTYSTTGEDNGKYLRVRITPVDAKGLAGSPVLSDAVGVGAGG